MQAVALLVAALGVLSALPRRAEAQQASPAPAAKAPPGMVAVGPGTYRPFYPSSPAKVAVPMHRFWLDEVPVTQGHFLRFVTKHPEWRRDRVHRLFADGHYLAGWVGPAQLGAALDAEGPVVGVSWFAAKAYCADRGARLPTEAEWEFAAGAGRKERDGRSDPELTERILAWYSAPTPARMPRVGATPPNAWGARDLVGLVWEWVYDFNSTLVSADARDSGDGDGARFCGLGALSAADPTDYATFMRMAMRSSLHADYTTKNLGFRCASDVTTSAP